MSNAVFDMIDPTLASGVGLVDIVPEEVQVRIGTKEIEQPVSYSARQTDRH
jgi:hypothetical protein